MKELGLLEKIKDQLEPVEVQAFHRRITSLKSNINYWTKRLSFERAEAQTEINRCEALLAKVFKDMKKKDDE